MTDDITFPINLDDYEIVQQPVPADESPRQVLLRVTGEEYPGLTHPTGDDMTWDDLRDIPWYDLILKALQTTRYIPPILLKRKEQE